MVTQAVAIFLLVEERGIRAGFGRQVRSQELVPRTCAAVRYPSPSAKYCTAYLTVTTDKTTIDLYHKQKGNQNASQNKNTKETS
jgi:hypothetical protein